ncbi:MaoC family dehydratase [Microbacterium sp. No. 7]|uniref:MaoC family dehydratase n=1 Tax=Microbacterium sp. No. 7 TaxID=1714373 RepID=UPI000AB43F1F|nr:MaoC family dehydratase [Microbacterium sp. No. 7]
MVSKRVLEGVRGLRSVVGEELGVSDWLLVDQEMIGSFARTTGDEQWIHTDVERAAAGPFGSTVAHGFLMLSLIPVLANSVYEVTGFSARVNYGVDKVRYPRPLLSGERVRDRVTVLSVDELPAGVRVAFQHRVEVEDGERPVCFAQTLTLFTP